MDLRTTFGIDRARDLLLIPSGESDIAVSPQIFYAARTLYNKAQKGQLVCMLRNPIEREIANYHHLVHTNSHLLQGITSLRQYAEEFDMEENYMTRILSGHEQGTNPATPQTLEIAKDVLRAKCLVGLHEQLPASINRVVKYLDLDSIVDAPPSARPCIDDAVRRERNLLYDLPTVKRRTMVCTRLLHVATASILSFTTMRRASSPNRAMICLLQVKMELLKSRNGSCILIARFL